VTPRPRLVYCLASYPALREYFNHLEIEGLREQGWDVVVFTFHQRSAAGTEDWNIDPSCCHTVRWGRVGTWLTIAAEAVRRRGAVLRLTGLILRRTFRHPLDLAKSLAVLAAGLALAPTMRREAAPIVHGGWCVFPGLLAFVLHRLQPESRFTVGCYAYDYDARFPLTVDMVREADLVFTHSEARARQLRAEWPALPTKVATVYRGTRVAPPRPRAGARGIVSVGGLKRFKGFDVLIRAVALLGERGLNPILTIVGGPDPEEPGVDQYLRALATQAGLGDRVRFTGALPHEAVLETIRTAEVFALASRSNDILPNVVKEAIAEGVPVVVTDTVGIGELVEDGRSGQVVPRGDVEAVATALTNILKDPSAAVVMAGAARAGLEARFDIIRTSAERSRVFEGLLRQPVGSR